MNQAEKQNAFLCILGEGLWGLQSALIMPMTMLTLVLRHYGAGAHMLGAVTAIESGFLVLPQIIGLFWFHRITARKKPFVFWHLLTVIPAIAMYGIIILALDGRASAATIRWLMLASFAVCVGAIGVIYSVWMDWLAHLFHRGIRGSVMGLVWFAASALGTLAALVAGRVLHHHPGIDTYAWIFLAAAGIATISIVLFLWIKEPLPDLVTTPLTRRDLLRRFRVSLQVANFRSFLAGRILASAGFCIAPFVAVHFQSRAGGSLPDGTVVLCGAAATIAAALANIVFGRLGDRRGHRVGLVIGAVTQVVTLLLLLLGSGLIPCVLVYVGIGICGGVSIISHNNMLFETCPHDARLAHITVGNLVTAIPMLVAPLLAGALAHSHGLPVLFVTSMLISLVAAAWVMRRVREPRDQPLAG
ncbi:MAG: MFS transporter [Verrucomicrobia bacterium]|nr:MFS transporter [Verrucomicrobiota bacterium]